MTTKEMETPRLQPFHRVIYHVMYPVARSLLTRRLTGGCHSYFSALLFAAWVLRQSWAREYFQYTDARIAALCQISTRTLLLLNAARDSSVCTTPTSHQNRTTTQGTPPRYTTCIQVSCIHTPALTTPDPRSRFHVVCVSKKTNRVPKRE